MRLGFLAAGYVVFWLSFPALAFVPELWPYTGAAFLLRQVSLVVLYSLAAKKLGEKLNPFQMLAFDFIYVFCFLYFGIAGFFSRRKSWN